MKLILQVVLTTFLILIISNPLLMADTNDFCANKWPNDYKMREDCQKQQIEAQNELFSIAEKEGLVKNGSLSAGSIGSGKEKIIHRCMSKWIMNQFKTYNYKMIVYCIKNQ